jgi:tetratricopeptide (TPR) repeat protein
VFSSLDLARLYGRRVSARTILSRVGLSLLAVSILGMVLFRKPILSETHFWLGTWALRKQESAGEIPAPVRHHWQRAFDLNPGNLKAKFWLAMARDSDVLGALGHRNYEQAVRLAEDNVRFMPEYSGFHQTLSIARRDAGDLKGAAEAMKQAIFVQRNTDMVRFAPRVMLPIWTSESDLHHILAHIYYDMEHYTEAYEEMKHIGRIINRRQAEIGIHWDPIFSPSDEVFIGKILWKLEEKEAAELCFRSALRRGGKYTRETTMEQLRLFGWEPPASDEGVGIPVGPLIPIAPGEVIGEDQDARPGNDEPAPR